MEKQSIFLNSSFLIQCVFISVDLPCNNCRGRNPSYCCVKKYGPKRQEQISRSLPSAPKGIITEQQVHLLQFLYSERFASSGGSLAHRLFLKLASCYGESISLPTLRGAMLAYSQHFLTGSGMSVDCQYYAMCVQRMLSTRNDSLNEGDLFAASLLTALSRFSTDPQAFYIHSDLLIQLLQNFIPGQRCYSSLTISLWHLFHELILEHARFLPPETNARTLEICHQSRTAISQPTFSSRLDIFLEFSRQRQTELHHVYRCLWQDLILIRRCFRFAILRQSVNDFQKPAYFTSIVAEMKYYHRSSEMKKFMTRVVMQRLSEEQDYLLSTLALIIYRLIGLIVILLEGEGILQSAASVEALSAATDVLDLFGTLSIPFFVAQPDHPSWNAVDVLPRLLCIIGLQFPRRSYPRSNTLIDRCLPQ